jgi:site-specific DNA-methyltransferase (adenine-specific)
VISVILDDCVEALWRGDGSTFDFCLADPPFNISHGYDGYDDNIPEAQYRSFTTQWIEAVWRRLSPGAAFVIHGSIKLRPTFWRSIIKLDLDSHYESETVWSYRFGQCRRSDWIDNHCPQIILRKPGERKWHPEAVLVPSDRASKYGDKRVEDYANGGSRPPGTVWGQGEGQHWGRVQGNSKERWNHHPNQLPLKMVGRHIAAYTQPGDHVLDPFCGSGTTALASLALGRSCTTFDVSQTNIESAERRLVEQLDLAKTRLSEYGRIPA